MVLGFAPAFFGCDDAPEAALRRAKFTVPALPRTVLPRPRLAAQLRGLVERLDGEIRLAVVSAPVASGKTTLVAGLAREWTRGSVAWCTLDERDDDPTTFGVSILEATLAVRSPELLGRAARAGRPADDALGEAMAIAAAGDEPRRARRARSRSSRRTGHAGAAVPRGPASLRRDRAHCAR